MYAGRTLCYEDTSRDLDVVFGAPLLDDIAAPLDVLLRAARWMVTALEDGYGAVFREMYEELRAEAGDRPVALADLWFLVQGLFWGDGERPVDAVAAEFAARWAGLFGLDTLPAGTTEVRLRGGRPGRPGRRGLPRPPGRTGPTPPCTAPTCRSAPPTRTRSPGASTPWSSASCTPPGRRSTARSSPRRTRTWSGCAPRWPRTSASAGSGCCSRPTGRGAPAGPRSR